MAFCTHCGAQNQENAQFCINCGTTLATGAAAPPPPPVGVPAPIVQVGPLGMPYATWGDRVIGYLIDSVLVGIAMIILYSVLGTFFLAVGGLSGLRRPETLGPFSGGICCLMIVVFPIATLLVGLFNRVYLVATRGASIGQGVMKLKVVDGNGNLLSMGTAFVRLLAQVVLAMLQVGFVLDVLWPLWDEKRQTLHDKAVNCYVIKVS